MGYHGQAGDKWLMCVAVHTLYFTALKKPTNPAFSRTSLFLLSFSSTVFPSSFSSKLHVLFSLNFASQSLFFFLNRSNGLDDFPSIEILLSNDQTTPSSHFSQGSKALSTASLAPKNVHWGIFYHDFLTENHPLGYCLQTHPSFIFFFFFLGAGSPLNPEICYPKRIFFFGLSMWISPLIHCAFSDSFLNGFSFFATQ